MNCEILSAKMDFGRSKDEPKKETQNCEDKKGSVEGPIALDAVTNGVDTLEEKVRVDRKKLEQLIEGICGGKGEHLSY